MADLDVIKGLIEDTLFSTQPAMVISLRASASSPLVRNVLHSLTSFESLKPKHKLSQMTKMGCCVIDPKPQSSLFPGLHGPFIGGIQVCPPVRPSETTSAAATQGDLK